MRHRVLLLLGSLIIYVLQVMLVSWLLRNFVLTEMHPRNVGLISSLLVLFIVWPLYQRWSKRRAEETAPQPAA